MKFKEWLSQLKQQRNENKGSVYINGEKVPYYRGVIETKKAIRKIAKNHAPASACIEYREGNKTIWKVRTVTKPKEVEDDAE